MSRCSSHNPSVVTDAGDQAALQQELARTSPPAPTYDLASLLASIKITTSPFELQRSILEAYQSTWDDQNFLPNGRLSRLITNESVTRELTKHLGSVLKPTQIMGLADAVCAETVVQKDGKQKIKTFRKVFALLVLAEAAAMILQFLGEDVSDLDLPLTPIKCPSLVGFSRKDETALLACFAEWSPMKLQNFHDHQWKLLAPFFSQGKDGDAKHYVLQDGRILPFVALAGIKKDETVVSGGFGRVFLVDIHEDHHHFQDDSSQNCNRGFAIKQQIYSTDREAFEREANILQKFTGKRSHRHIVSLLATYVHLDKFHLIFHRAEANLFAFWRQLYPRPAFDYRNVLWMASQCAGIAEGLFRLHQRLTATLQHESATAAPAIGMSSSFPP